MPADVISTEAERVDNALLHDYLTCKVSLEEPKIWSMDPNFALGNICGYDEQRVRMPWGCPNYDDDGDKMIESDDIPTASRQWRTATELGTFDCATSDVDGYEGDNGNDADSDEVEDELQTDDGSTQNQEDWGHSTWDWGHSTKECNDWTVNFRPVRYNNGEANAMASDVSEVKTVL